jgi:ATPase subunit of ABC transporter with duplicated ATPase domains
MIHLRNVRFKYNSRYILNGLDLSVAPGDRIGLVGPNGSGKTTLCQIIRITGARVRRYRDF